MSESYIEIELNHQPVELCKLLKIANLVSGGGEAKVVISEGYVLLNGEVEFQKRKKVYHEDVIEFNGEVIQLVINEQLSEDDVLVEEELNNDYSTNTHNDESFKDKDISIQNQQKKSPAKPKADQSFIESNNIDNTLPKKRRPISF